MTTSFARTFWQKADDQEAIKRTHIKWKQTMGLPKDTAFHKAVAEGKDIERQQIENELLGVEKTQ